MTERALGFRVTILGVHLAVVSDSAAVAEALDQYVLPWLPRAAVGSSTADRLVEVRRLGSGAGLEILVDGLVAGVVPSPEAAIPWVQRALDEAVVRCQTEVAVVHGGVVAHGGRAIILPGPTGAGKSTLVAELVRQGAPYLSDEYALIDADGCVHPYPRPLLLRDASGDDQAPRLATELGGTVARGPMPAGLIVGARHAPDATPVLQAMSQSDGLLLLLRNTPQALADHPWIMAPMARAVARAACYGGPRGEARATAAAILELASSVRREAGRWPSGACCSTPAGSAASP